MTTTAKNDSNNGRETQRGCSAFISAAEKYRALVPWPMQGDPNPSVSCFYSSVFSKLAATKMDDNISKKTLRPTLLVDLVPDSAQLLLIRIQSD